MKPFFLTYLRHSFAFKLVMLYVLLFVVSVSILTGVTYWAMVAAPREETAAIVQAERDTLATIYKLEGAAVLVKALESRAQAPAARKAFHVFISAQGDAITSNLPSWPSVPQFSLYEIEADRYLEGDEIDYQALSLEQVFADGSRLIVGRDIEDIGDREERLIEALVAASVIAVLLGSAGGVFMSLAVSRRLEAVNTAAQQVINGDLSRRVHTFGTGDDFDKLAATLNEMLDRIEKSVEAISRVSDSVAHELRLPLTRLHAELEELADSAEQGKLEPEHAARAIAESERLKAVFEALLRIARIETGRHDIVRDRVNLTTLVTDAAELYQPEVDNRSLTLDCRIAGPVFTAGDPNLLFQMIANLIDNAVKYAPRESTIRVSLTRKGKRVRFSVENEGEGIRQDERPRVTERFYRGENWDVPGLGLGLSLADVVVKAHGGRLAFVDTAGGFAVVVFLSGLRARDDSNA
ncbi:ATP-binding protein [Kordiimonas sp.]|uniref:HAMP domain-containing sensor histidine kinase n=1 Tax=Kordiimonas sp. TaxID=1970157 RepID=UPI003A95B804